MWLFAVVYVAALALRQVRSGPAWDGWFSTVVEDRLGHLTVWAPAAVRGMAVSRVDRERPGVLLVYGDGS